MSAAVESRQDALDRLLRASPVIAVVTIDDAAHAVPMARALCEGGVRGIEITLRTAAALDAIRAIADAVDEAIVGAGTVLNPSDFTAAHAAGARFAVSPGATPALIEAAADAALPWLPGAATASEAMALQEHGYRYVKWFPAAALGGPDTLRTLAGPLPRIRWCTTGGIDRDALPRYLALPNVAAVGASWLTPRETLAAGDWRGIAELARSVAPAARSRG